MIKINFHLRGPRLMAERVYINTLDITMIIDFFKQRIKFIDRINTIGLFSFFRTA